MLGAALTSPDLVSELHRHYEQHCRILDRDQVVPCRRQNQMITHGTFPHGVAGGHADPTLEDLVKLDIAKRLHARLSQFWRFPMAGSRGLRVAGVGL